MEPDFSSRDFGRLEGKLDAVLSEMRGRQRDAERRLGDLETWRKSVDLREGERTGAIKAARWLWGVITATLGLLGGVLGGHLIR